MHCTPVGGHSTGTEGGAIITEWIILQLSLVATAKVVMADEDYNEAVRKAKALLELNRVDFMFQSLG